MLVYIDEPKIISDDNKSRFVTSVYFGVVKKELYIETDNEYSIFFDTNIVDGFLVAILPYCMMIAKKQEVIVKSAKCVSKRLLFQLSKYYIPVVSENISYFESVKIEIEPTEVVHNEAYAVATGISGGGGLFLFHCK